MSKSFLQDHKGQLYTIEAVLAAGIMLCAVFFISASTPATVTPGQDFAKVQLKKYGQDVLMLLSYNEKELAVGELEYTLYREHNPRPPGKWYHDKHITTSPEKQNEGLTTPDGNQNWTTQYLVMIGDNDDLYDGEEEILTSYFALQGATTLEWLWPKDNGTLYSLMPFTSGDKWKVEDYDSNSITFEEDSKKKAGEEDYTANMVWFEDDKGGVSNPVIVWVDKKPEDHDRVVTLDMENSQGELNETLQFAEIGQGQYVVVNTPSGSNEKFHVIGANGTEIKGLGFNKGVTVTKLATGKYKVTFDKPAKGGYSIHWGSGHSWQWSDPVFVLVGKPGVVAGEVLSPLEATIRGAFSLDELNDMLHSYIPENVEYNLYFYDSDGKIVNNEEGAMIITNGNPTTEAVTVNVPVFATIDGTNYATYEAKLVLWYK